MYEPAELHSYLSGVEYPATRERLIAAAERNGADDDVLHRLRNIEDVQYDSREAVSAAFSFIGETSIDYGHVTVYDQ